MPPVAVITDVTAATMTPGDGVYGLIRDAAIIIQNGLVRWVGPASRCPGDFSDAERHSYGGRLVTPALIDCHTHIVHGGNRAREFEMRLNSTRRGSPMTLESIFAEFGRPDVGNHVPAARQVCPPRGRTPLSGQDHVGTLRDLPASGDRGTHTRHSGQKKVDQLARSGDPQAQRQATWGVSVQASRTESDARSGK